MITSTAFAGKRYALLGLARSGLAAAEALLASGAEIAVWDRREGPREQFAGRATIADPMAIDLAGFDGVVLSPGVPLNSHPIVEKAREADVPLIGDIELFAMARKGLPQHRVVGITGTNGKSTTTALTHHLLERAGIPARMAGNIGFPILSQDPLPEGGVYVVELSSYQIDLTYSLACDAAGLTNITPDHLDRYDGIEAYAHSKSRLFTMQEPGQLGVFGCDDALTKAIQQAEVRRRQQGKAACAQTDAISRHQGNWPSLQGPHNLQNAAIAAALAVEMGLSQEQVLEGLASFTGLPHRMEVVGENRGVLFINDSKATNPASTAPALSAYPPAPTKRVHWICGGLPKGDDLDECAVGFGNIAAAYTIGEAGPNFADILEPHMPVRRCEMLSEALCQAIQAAKVGDVVLFSPACASFDQFRDYEVRGNAFRELVSELTGGKATEASQPSHSARQAS